MMGWSGRCELCDMLTSSKRRIPERGGVNRGKRKGRGVAVPAPSTRRVRRLLSRVEKLPVARGHRYPLAVGYDVLSDPEGGVFALAGCRGELLLGALLAERGGPFGDPVSGLLGFHGLSPSCVSEYRRGYLRKVFVIGRAR